MQKRKKTYLNWLSDKYRLILLNDQSFENVFSLGFRFRNILMAVSFVIVVLFCFNFLIIAYSPLKTYIPGFDDVKSSREVNELLERTDSLQHSLRLKEQYIDNIRRLLQGEVPEDPPDIEQMNAGIYDSDVNFENDPAFADSLERAGVDKEAYLNFIYSFDHQADLKEKPLHKPVNNGVVTSTFDATTHHYALDLVAEENSEIMAVLDGRVVFAEWSAITGHVIILQHANNLLTVYKHNDELLQNVGNFVRAGEPVAIIGDSGALTTGPHLHFEMWYRGMPVDPQKFYAFNH